MESRLTKTNFPFNVSQIKSWPYEIKRKIKKSKTFNILFSSEQALSVSVARIRKSQMIC